jgi:RNA polymerase sigma-70 factor (ECF subfamily)
MSLNECSDADSSRERLYFQLFMAHQGSLYAYILASVHNYSDADDILQETATVMWRRFSEFAEGTSFVAWGIAIARLQILKFFNDHKRSRLQFDNDLLMELGDLALEETSRIKAIKERFGNCLRRQSDSHQKLLRLRYNDGMTIKAIANLTGKPTQGMYKVSLAFRIRCKAALKRLSGWKGGRDGHCRTTDAGDVYSIGI